MSLVENEFKYNSTLLGEEGAVCLSVSSKSKSQDVMCCSTLVFGLEELMRAHPAHPG